MNFKKTILAAGIAIVIAASQSLCAQTGCEDSPEDATVLLALLAVAGAIAAGVWRSRGPKR